MKNSIKTFMKISWVLLIALTLFVSSCAKTDEQVISDNNTALSLKSAVVITPPVISLSVVNGTCGVQNQALIAGQNYTAGNVSVSTTNDNKLYVTVTTQNGWALKTIHLFVGDKINLPVNKSGNPVPGNFPFNNSFSTYQSVVSYEFNLSDFNSSFVVALHAEVDKLDPAGQVLQSETAWADGTRFVLKGNWATYLNYTVVSCPAPVLQPVATCTSYRNETAFGGNASGVGNAWWYYYDGVGVETIWAGQSINVGYVTLVNGNLLITLTNGWELDPSTAESVKIQGYSTLPASRPAAGQFTTYKGTSLTVPVGSFPYYVIHLDVRKCNSTN